MWELEVERSEKLKIDERVGGGWLALMIATSSGFHFAVIGNIFYVHVCCCRVVRRLDSRSQGHVPTSGLGTAYYSTLQCGGEWIDA